MKKYYLYATLLFMVLLIVSCSGGGVSSGTSAHTTGTATLTWAAPTTNFDNTPFIDPAGYRVYYGTASGNYDHSITLGNLTTYQVTNLPVGHTYYFTIRVFNVAGVESDLSNEQSKTI
jgi:hypothetical protein